MTDLITREVYPHNVPVDMEIVTEWVENPDLYADAGEEFIYNQLEQITKAGMVETLFDLNGWEAFTSVITSNMYEQLPEFIETYCQWNDSQTVEDMRKEIFEANHNTMIGILEGLGIIDN